MTCIYSPSVYTVERVPPPSKHNFGPLYATAAEERAAIVQREQYLVEDFSEELASFMRKQARIMDEIYETRSRFNAMAYISRLPEEILAMILEAYVAAYWAQWYPLMSPGRNPYTHLRKPYTWITGVLHVCRQWRRVALSTPRLWTCIAHQKIPGERLEFLLKYSGTAPLTLRNDDLLRRRDTYGRVTLKDALCLFQRVETLALALDNETLALLDNLPGENVEGEGHVVDAPLMQHLLFDLSRIRLDNPSSLLRNINMPGLRSLMLNKAPMKLIQHLACSSLTCLDVWFDDDFSEVEMLDLLDNLPGLQQLYIGYTDLDESAITPQRTVSLLTLERLHLYGTPAGVTRLLQQLAFPSTAVIELSTEHGISASLLALISSQILGTGNVSDNRDIPAHQHPTESMRPVCPHKIVVDLEHWPRTTVMVYFWCIPTSKPAHDSEGNGYRADRETLSAWDSSWYRSDTPRLTFVHTTGMLAVEDEVNILDLRELVSLKFKVGSYFRYGGLEELAAFCRLFQGPVFLKLETLCIDSTGARTDELVGEILQAVTTLAAASDSTHDDNTHSTAYPSNQPPSRNLPLWSLKTLLLHQLYIDIEVDESEPDQIHWPTYTHVLVVLSCCAQLGFKLPLLRLTDAYARRKVDHAKAADLMRAAVMELGIVDELEITWTEVTEE